MTVGTSVNTRPTEAAMEAWDELLTISEAAEELGVSQTQLRRFCQNGMITRFGPGADKSYRFKRADVEQLREGVEAAEQQKKAGAAEESINSAVVGLLKQSQTHLETILRTTLQPMIQGLELNSRIANTALERVASLEAERTAYLETWERLVTQDHERTLMAKAHQSKQKRQDQAFGLLMQRAPKLLDQVQASLGGGNEKVKAAIELLSSLEPIQLQALLASGFLSPEQEAAVRKIVPDLASKPVEAEGEESSGEATNTKQE